MTRKTGTFPSYVKLDVHEDEPPKNWDDGCRRCAACGKSWPNLAFFSPTPCCNATGGIVATGSPDMDWPLAVKEMLKARFDRWYDKYNDGVTDEELYWTPDDSFVSEQEINEGMEEIEHLLDEETNDRSSTRGGSR